MLERLVALVIAFGLLFAVAAAWPEPGVDARDEVEPSPEDDDAPPRDDPPPPAPEESPPAAPPPREDPPPKEDEGLVGGLLGPG